MITVLAFLFVLGVLIFVHELGHFLVARFYGVRVLTFSLGFGPKLIKVRRGATEYCISLIPLGGYVKLAGETVQDQRTGEPDEFLSKSKWVRCQVYLAGPFMNLGLALVVVAIVLSLGADVPLYQSSPPGIGTVTAGRAGGAAGLRPGGRIVSVVGYGALPPRRTARSKRLKNNGTQSVPFSAQISFNPGNRSSTPERMMVAKVRSASW